MGNDIRLSGTALKDALLLGLTEAGSNGLDKISENMYVYQVVQRFCDFCTIFAGRKNCLFYR